MNQTTRQFENKMRSPAPENKGGFRVPTGELDRVLFVRVIAEDGALPVLDIRTAGRSPADFSDDCFRPTAAGVSIGLQFADALVEQIERARAAHLAGTSAAA